MLRAVTVGNYEIAEMLLDHGAGLPPVLSPSFLFGSFFLVPPELYPGERTCLVSPGDCGGEGWRLSGGASKVYRGARVILPVAMEFGFFNCRFFRNTIYEHFSLLCGCHRVSFFQISRKPSELSNFQEPHVISAMAVHFHHQLSRISVKPFVLQSFRLKLRYCRLSFC